MKYNLLKTLDNGALLSVCGVKEVVQEEVGGCPGAMAPSATFSSTEAARAAMPGQSLNLAISWWST